MRRFSRGRYVASPDLSNGIISPILTLRSTFLNIYKHVVLVRHYNAKFSLILVRPFLATYFCRINFIMVILCLTIGLIIFLMVKESNTHFVSMEILRVFVPFSCLYVSFSDVL